MLFPKDFTRPAQELESLRDSLSSAAMAAEELYRGQHHQRLMRGVEEARAAGHLEVDLRIVSAGYGVVRGCDKLVPYECTFQGRTKKERDRLAESAGTPQDVRGLLGGDFDLAVVLLGEDYLNACRLDTSSTLGGPTIVFCARSMALSLPPLDGLRAMSLRTHDTRRFACGLVGLKGEIGARLLSYLAAEPTHMTGVTSPDLLDRLAAFVPVTRQVGLPVG
jgi:hypothetical protein